MLDPRLAMIGLAFVAGVCSTPKPPRMAPDGPAANPAANACRETDAGARAVRELHVDLSAGEVVDVDLKGGSMDLITCMPAMLKGRTVPGAGRNDSIVIPSPLGDACEWPQIRGVSDDGSAESLHAIEWVCSPDDQPSGWVRIDLK